MKFLTYSKEEQVCTGVLSLDEKTVYSLKEIGINAESMIKVIKGLSDEEKMRIESFLENPDLSGTPLNEVTIKAPILNPIHDFICVGQNYVEHAKESARFKGVAYKKPTYPVYFSKRVNRAIGDGGIIALHEDVTSQLDYETELAVVIGRECSKVSPEDVMDYIFGFTIVNDISARDIQHNHSQFFFGKSLDDITAMGPYIVTKESVSKSLHFDLSTKINGELRQDSNTKDFIFDIPYMISQLSSGMTLYPGDVFITGTPSGVGMGFNPPKFLKSGDVIESFIEGIGSLTNVVK